VGGTEAVKLRSAEGDRGRGGRCRRVPRTGSGSTRSGTSSFGGVWLRFIGVERRLDEETRSTSASGDTSLLWFLEEEVAQMQLG
jgi:hypothetical protein